MARLKLNRLLLAAYVLSISSDVYAEAASHHEHHSGASSLIPYWVNFAILFAILFFVLRGKVASFWSSRQQSVASRVLDSAAELRKSQSVLESARAKLARVDSEAAALKAEIAKQAEFDAQAALSAARNKVSRLAKQAEEFARAEMRRAEQDARRDFVNASVDQAKLRLVSDESLNFQGVQETLVGSSKQLVIQ